MGRWLACLVLCGSCGSSAVTELVVVVETNLAVHARDQRLELGQRFGRLGAVSTRTPRGRGAQESPVALRGGDELPCFGSRAGQVQEGRWNLGDRIGTLEIGTRFFPTSGTSVFESRLKELTRSGHLARARLRVHQRRHAGDRTRDENDTHRRHRITPPGGSIREQDRVSVLIMRLLARGADEVKAALGV